ncbi:MAG: LytR C-terminal domain-containing protein [Nesterenkonia sp.]|uniref:LytR C-terminal domain-containing protein n=1 Tax=Nesterenkonia marinintestina TaxID=2979865 RepID=UPI0021BE4BF1|nr:LytR C-terminal domain-containing protein [Nesterenkonia sp. GX14115]MDO5492481.1 LytR C-terminal domain-containing protein [Nesterenkonia sp.]
MTDESRAPLRRRILVGLGSGAALAAVTALSWLMIDGTLEVDIFSQDIPAGEDCPTVTLSPVTTDRVTVDVYNVTNRPGLAGGVAEDLSDRGYRVGQVDSDYAGDTGFDVIIRAGDRGLRQAYTLQQEYSRTYLDVDDRDGFTVDLVIGDEYEGMVPTEDVVLEQGRLQCR